MSDTHDTGTQSEHIIHNDISNYTLKIKHLHNVNDNLSVMHDPPPIM